MRIAGTFNGTGAALYLGIGFIPDYVRVENLESASMETIEWSRHMARAADLKYGRQTSLVPLSTVVGTANYAALTSVGVTEYLGGDLITSASTAYLVRDPAWDKRDAYSTGNAITKWTLDTAGNRTGHFDKEASTTYVGEGSEVWIQHPHSHRPARYRIEAMTSNGEATDEVTLNIAAPSGIVVALGPMYDYKGAAAGVTMPPGFALTEVTNVNVSGELCWFEAGTYD